MNHKFFGGLTIPTYTSFNADGSISLDVIPSYAEYLKSQHAKGVFICGSTGEGLLMTTEERKMVAEAWMPYVDEDFRLIVHVGSTSYETARDLSVHAAAIGVHAISCMGPCFFPPKNVQDLVRFCVRVASAAPETPFYYYHMPALSGVNLKMIDFLNEAENAIPNLVGIKYTSPDLMDMFHCLTYNGNKFDILNGHDQLLICALALGARGAIGSTFNYMSPIYDEIISNFNNGDIVKSREGQQKANEILSLMHATGNSLSAGKAIMKMKGLDFGPCREPLSNLTDKQIRELKVDLDRFGFFD